MGEKKDLRHENGALREKIVELEQQLQLADDQLTAAGMRAMSGTALAPYREPGRTELAARGQRADDTTSPILKQIADELGVSAGSYTDEQSLGEAVIDQIASIKNPHGDDHAGGIAVPTQDSLAEAIEHNRHQRIELSQGLTDARAIVNRVASALQVGTWDKDGSQIIEKAQRWAVFGYWVKKRIAEWKAAVARRETQTATTLAQMMVDEYSEILAALGGAEALAKWASSKPVGTPMPATLAEAAERPEPERVFTARHVSLIRYALSQEFEAPDRTLIELFKDIEGSRVARDELVFLMNTFIVPIIRKLSGTSPDAPAVH